MTKPWSAAGDNGGRCESCDRPETVNQVQQTYPLRMTGESGPVSGTMWLCPQCLSEHRERDAARKRS